jgi:RHS repeat-associated protein
MKGGSTAYAGTKSNYYYRDYTWNERNLLSKTKDDSYTTEYLYGGDGQRAVKRSSVSETLYFNKFFTQRYDDAYQGAGGRMSKHIFLGNDRIVTKQIALGTGENYDNADTAVEKLYTYYYHADHLGSTSVVTDHNGEVYERLEYTPYGETWLDETSGDTYFDTPYRFSAKEKDEETGLYYYGARYLDPKYSRWISADPALGEYLPQAPVNDEAKKHNRSLPGGGGIYNTINLNLYHYAGNNPIKYTDPDGKFVFNIGVAASGGAGVAGAVETGVSVGYSQEKGITFGTYTSESIGSEFGVSTFAGLIVNADVKSKGVETGNSRAMVIGGSCDKVLGVGIDVSYDLDSRKIDVIGSKGLKGGSLKIGVADAPTVGEVHILYNTTQTKGFSLRDIGEKIGQRISNFEKQVTNYIIDKTLEGYGY